MLFNWFKKKDRMVPLDPAPEQVKTGKPEHKPFTRSALTGAKKPAPAAPRQTPPGDAKDTTRINTSESTVIRIGKLGEVLLQYNMISRENLEKALAIQQQSFVPSGPQDKAVQKRKMLGEILIENNFVTEEQLLSAFARHCRIPYIKLNKYGLPKEAIKSVPEDLILKHKVMPVDKIGSILMLAVTDPYDTNAVEEVKARTGLKVKSILCKQSEFAEMVKFYYPHIQDDSQPAPADIASQVAPAAPETPPVPPVSTPEPRVGEETAVFKIEELPFPEPPPTTQKPEETIAGNVQEIPQGGIPVEQATPPTEPVSNAHLTGTTSMPEDKKESFLGGSIEDHSSDREHATHDHDDSHELLLERSKHRSDREHPLNEVMVGSTPKA
ncbi:MAG: hypothetical protein AAB038_04175, partial [Planctomycetota bacterium]